MTTSRIVNISENLVAQINSNIFFQEFTFQKNEFYPPDTKIELQLADNVVWIDDLLFIFQIKDRNKDSLCDSSSESKWYQNKVIKKGVSQIKDTLEYFSKYPQIIIQNERGYKIDVAKAKQTFIKNIIIFNPNEKFPDDLRFNKFHESRTAGIIHLFHIEDYFNICKYLITPSEINEYLEFREKIYLKHKCIINNFPEQYVLGHFLETSDISFIKPEYVETLKRFKQEYSNDILFSIIKIFRDNTETYEKKDDYFYILKEIAKLKRNEFKEFQKRFFISIEKCNEQNIVVPYRISFPRINCGFVFIPLAKKNSNNWKIALHNYTMVHKYDQKLSKCIGIIFFKSSNSRLSYEVFWEYVEIDWTYNEEMEKVIKEKFPFREIHEHELERYEFDK
ncbi:MAG: hypothetical protein KJ808_06540 [Acidobacteria bacterium]|nr:hypothetical protein [Acidobacteriota bacterium]MBU4307723.1 hypothetical protein [Acidobacteriota bacterium]MCG2810050.1 hypothetical protein [Candidatus Aminicenantes bacterium]